MTWTQKAAALAERHPVPGTPWEQVYLKVAAEYGRELGMWLAGLYARMPDEEKGLLENCLEELRPLVSTLQAAATSGDAWLADGEPEVVATECRNAADALNRLFGCLDLFRDLRRDVEAYQQAPGWPDLPAILFDRSRVPAALQWFKKPDIKFADGELRR